MSKPNRISIGAEKAIQLAEANHWEGMTHRQIAEFQMTVQELTMPFGVFHEALEKAIGRSVWTHELALNFEGIRDELFEGKPAPTLQEIIELIPAEKRIIIYATE